ncbi:MAG: hypothetical protein ABI763_15970 [Bacteroidota bacterium]
MSKYEDSLVVRDALQLYFSEYHFADGGYTSKWFKIKLGRLYVPLPNIKSRIDAVKIHDVHHLVTGYNADWKGEVEIGAWEIATGCEKKTVAWLLNLGSIFVGIFLYPRSLFNAFMRGRKCVTSLYYNTIYNELLDKTLGELRKKINIDLPGKNITSDYLLFAFWCFVASTYHLLIALVLVGGLYICYLLLS